jgi:hypothetical protein
MNEAEELFIKWISEVKQTNEPYDIRQYIQNDAYSFSQDAFIAGFKAGYEYKLKHNAQEQLQK